MLLGGIDLGGTKIQSVIVDADHRVLGQARRATPRTGGPPDVVTEMVLALREAATQAGIETAALGGVGVGSPGAVDAQRGTVERAGNLPSWTEPFPLADALASDLGTRVVLGNDVGVALDAEARLGAGVPYGSFVGLFWGTGIGGGVIIHRRRWLGRGAAGEIGHMVVRMGGARCPCGRRGCVEAYAGRRAMERRARRAVEKGQRTQLFRIMAAKGRDQLSSGIFASALEKGDRYTERLLERAVDALGAGLASSVNLLDVEAVIIGGGLGVRLGQPWADKIRDAMAPHLFRPEAAPVVAIAALGDLAGAIGGCLLAEDSATARREREPAHAK